MSAGVNYQGRDFNPIHCVALAEGIKRFSDRENGKK